MKRDKSAPRFVSVRQVHDAPTVLWNLLEERDPAANISHKAMPTGEEHLDFVTHHPYKAWFLIKLKGEWVGAAYVTRPSILSPQAVGLAIFKEYQRKGLGRWAVGEMRRRFPGPMLANIAPTNPASQAFFESLGFVHIQNTLVSDDAK